jgi:ATP-binding cassette subfamily B protein
MFLDGVDMETIDYRTFRKHVGVVTQHSVYFSGSVGDNVAYGLPGVKRTDLIRALERAQAMEFVKDLPGGIDCLLGEGGYKLSGGQQQRLSIARALIRDPRILIFDEATSALDVHTETILQDTLMDMIRGRTTLMISHRLSTVRNAEQIIVMEQGRIVTSGNHEKLMGSRNFYSQAFHIGGEVF